MTQRRPIVTNKDVAHASGVSPATVSLVLNGKAQRLRLSDETIDRVRQAAADLAYVPNRSARALATRRSRTIAVVEWQGHQSLHVPVFEDLAIAAIETASASDYLVTFPPFRSDAASLERKLRSIQVDGLIVQGGDLDGPLGEALAVVGLPFVSIDAQGGDALANRVGQVSCDEAHGGRLIAERFVAQGHEHIAIMAPQSATRGVRFEHFVRTLGTDRGITRITVDDWSAGSGYHGMRTMQRDHGGPTALFAGNDLLAAGAIRAASDLGRRVPADMAVAGFGDFRLSAYLTPALTTVRWPTVAQGTRATELLLDHLEGRDTTDHRSSVRLPTELVVRESA